MPRQSALPRALPVHNSAVSRCRDRPRRAVPDLGLARARGRWWSGSTSAWHPTCLRIWTRPICSQRWLVGTPLGNLPQYHIREGDRPGGTSDAVPGQNVRSRRPTVVVLPGMWQHQDPLRPATWQKRPAQNGAQPGADGPVLGKTVDRVRAPARPHLPAPGALSTQRPGHGAGLRSPPGDQSPCL